MNFVNESHAQGVTASAKPPDVPKLHNPYTHEVRRTVLAGLLMAALGVGIFSVSWFGYGGILPKQVGSMFPVAAVSVLGLGAVLTCFAIPTQGPLRRRRDETIAALESGHYLVRWVYSRESWEAWKGASYAASSRAGRETTPATLLYGLGLTAACVCIFLVMRTNQFRSESAWMWLTGGGLAAGITVLLTAFDWLGPRTRHARRGGAVVCYVSRDLVVIDGQFVPLDGGWSRRLKAVSIREPLQPGVMSSIELTFPAPYDPDMIRQDLYEYVPVPVGSEELGRKVASILAAAIAGR